MVRVAHAAEAPGFVFTSLPPLSSPDECESTRYSGQLLDIFVSFWVSGIPWDV